MTHYVDVANLFPCPVALQIKSYRKNPPDIIDFFEHVQPPNPHEKKKKVQWDPYWQNKAISITLKLFWNRDDSEKSMI